MRRSAGSTRLLKRPRDFFLYTSIPFFPRDGAYGCFVALKLRAATLHYSWRFSVLSGVALGSCLPLIIDEVDDVFHYRLLRRDKVQRFRGPRLVDPGHADVPLHGFHVLPAGDLHDDRGGNTCRDHPWTLDSCA